ncbi:MAG: hypothetical protein C5B59_18235 [Bacteroidetes bacterium]|nr:MAG: hypothetical protein C5B59_18235 [Bacteroidota bacterium]
MEKAISILGKKQTFNRISPSCSLREAINIMNTMNTDYVAVVDDNEEFVGILTEHEIARQSRSEKVL